MLGRGCLMLSRLPVSLFLSLFGIVISLGACVTPSNPTSKSSKPYEACICGPLTGNADPQPYCAIWSPNSRTDRPQAAWKAFPQPSCQPSDCSKLFSSFCQKIQMAPSAPPVPQGNLDLPCYCDAILIENDKGQVQNVCAAWAEGSSFAIEYYVLDDCKTQRCAEDPFVRAKSLCKQGFRAFYPPLQNRR